MKVGDMIRVKDGSGCYEDGEDTTCYWPEAKGQVGVVVEMTLTLRAVDSETVKRGRARVMMMGELVEFDARGLEVISESR